MDKKKMAVEMLKTASAMIDEAREILKEAGYSLIENSDVQRLTVHLYGGGSVKDLAEATGEQCEVRDLDHVYSYQVRIKVGNNLDIIDLEGYINGSFV